MPDVTLREWLESRAARTEIGQFVDYRLGRKIGEFLHYVIKVWDEGNYTSNRGTCWRYRMGRSNAIYHSRNDFITSSASIGRKRMLVR